MNRKPSENNRKMKQRTNNGIETQVWTCELCRSFYIGNTPPTAHGTFRMDIPKKKYRQCHGFFKEEWVEAKQE